MLGQFLECGPWEGVTLEKFLQACGLLKGPILEKGRTPPDEETVPETVCEELTVSPISCPLAACREEVQNRE